MEHTWMSADFAPFGPNSAFIRVESDSTYYIQGTQLAYTHTLAVVMRVLGKGGHQIPR